MNSKMTSLLQAVGVVLVTVGISSFSVPIGVIVLGAAFIVIGGLS
jgi:hypothetical protein